MVSELYYLSKDSLKNAITEIVTRGDVQFDNSRTDGRLGVSDCAVCKRKRYFDIKTPEKQKITCSLFLGTAVHSYLEKLIKDYDPHVQLEELSIVEFAENKHVCSRIDCVFQNEDFSDCVIVDIKTTKKRLEKWSEGIGDYIEQLNWYMGVKRSKKGYLIGISYADPFLPIENCIMVIEVSFSMELFKKTMKNFRELFAALETNNAPEGEFNYVWCSYCQHKLKCPKFYAFIGDFCARYNNIYRKTDITFEENYVFTQFLITHPQYFERTNTRTIEYKINFERFENEYRKCMEVLSNND